MNKGPRQPACARIRPLEVAERGPLVLSRGFIAMLDKKMSSLGNPNCQINYISNTPYLLIKGYRKQSKKQIKMTRHKNLEILCLILPLIYYKPW